MPALSSFGHQSRAHGDAHGCPACPHTVVGPSVTGSPNVYVNGKPVLRERDIGIHAACCGSNQWSAITGSGTVSANGLKVVRKDDPTQHCGSVGKMIEGSPNVNAGG